MKCSDVERVLPDLLDGAPDGALSADFETHVKSCPACSDLVSDLTLISSEARQLAATEEPAPRVWLHIAAALRAEGLIRDAAIGKPESVPAGPILLPAPVPVPTFSRRRWSAWWLAPVAAAIMAAGSYVVSHRPVPQVTQRETPAAPAATTSPVVSPVPEAPVATVASVPTPAHRQMARKSANPTDAIRPVAEPSPSAEDQQFLSVVSTRTPSMRDTYESQLRAVNADIRETQAYVDRNPGDADARQHLMDAYQQKALLYQIALDRIQ